MIPPSFAMHCQACGRPVAMCVCVKATEKAPARYVVRYGYRYCAVCGLEACYCKGHALPDPPASDGAESDLTKRVAEARVKAGGR